MNGNEMNRPRVLFAILDWGMGHASRSAPLIAHALRQNWEVHIASKGTALAFLQSQFQSPGIVFHKKPGPDIRYARRGNLIKIALQVPAFLSSIKAEEYWTKSLVSRHNITHIVSDNCYGVSHPSVPAALISHQLQLPVPFPLRKLAKAFVIRQARRFQAVWVPDTADFALSGKLAAANTLDHQIAIGVLSRLPLDCEQGKWKRVGMVSGPEPHRSLMEKALKAWILSDNSPGLLIAGRPNGQIEQQDNLTIWPNPTPEELSSALRGAQTVVCRSGYSSLLDLAALGKPAILVPTPGQPEQLQLAAFWKQRWGMAVLTQSDLENGLVPPTTGTIDSYEPNVLASAVLQAFVTH
jgi:UDP:flavonoid glycosyltransferase YjiC (YdhE family)